MYFFYTDVWRVEFFLFLFFIYLFAYTYLMGYLLPVPVVLNGSNESWDWQREEYDAQKDSSYGTFSIWLLNFSNIDYT